MTDLPRRRAERFVAPEEDPRRGDPGLGDEKATYEKYLRGQRLTLELKCDGLDPEQLARRAIEPSTISLLGLVRHLADVERVWFRQRFASDDCLLRYRSPESPDGDFDGALPDQAVVDEAWGAWREEVAFAERFVAEHDLDAVAVDGRGQPLSLRELLAHMIEEYARHNGHADFLRERIDGRIGS